MSSKVIFEDVTMSYNRWVQGIASREQSSGKITLFDLFDKYNKQFPNDSKEKNYIPPTLSNVTSYIGNIQVNNSNLRDKVRQTFYLPFCSEHVDKKDVIRKIYKNTKLLDKITQDIIQDLDKLVEKKEKGNKINNNETDL